MYNYEKLNYNQNSGKNINGDQCNYGHHTNYVYYRAMIESKFVYNDVFSKSLL